jgi:heptosyltransferase II
MRGRPRRCWRRAAAARTGPLAGSLAGLYQLSRVYRILIIGPSWVGDTVLAQPLFQRLHERHDRLQLDVLAPAWTRPLLERMPEVAATLLNPFAHGEFRLRERLRLARHVRERGYDQAIVLPNSFKSALVPRLARIPLRTGYVGELRQILLNDARRLDGAALPLMAERFAQLADPPGQALSRPLPTPSLQVSEVRRAHVLARLALTPDRPVACLCPGAEYGPAKRWPPEHFAALAAALQGRGFQVWLIGSGKDRGIGEAICRQALAKQGQDTATGGRGCRNLCGETDLAEALDLMSLAALVVSNDSGLMHVAAALHRPLLALYGSSTPRFTPPLSPHAQVLKLDLPCSPCFERVCPLGHFDCMRKLTPEQVLARVPFSDSPQA